MRFVQTMLVSLCGLTVAHAASWTALGTSADERSLVLADADSLRADGAFVELWQMETISPVWTPDKTEAGDVRSYKRLLQFDCKKRRYSLLSFSEYEFAWGAGKVINTNAISNPKLAPVTPETIGDMVFKYACASAKVRAEFNSESARIKRAFTNGD